MNGSNKGYGAVSYSNSGYTSGNPLTYVDVKEDFVFYIRNKSTGDYLIVDNDSTANGANVSVASKGSTSGQKWFFLKDSLGYKIRTRLNDYLLNPYGTTVSSGNNVTTWPFIAGDATQRWQMAKVGKFYAIINSANPSCAVTVQNGKNVIVSTYTGADTQLWSLECVGHTWNGGTVTKEPTCGETGVKTYTCTVCGTATTTVVLDKLTTHTWNSGVVTTPATCTSEGVKTFTCTVCTATKTESIAKLTTHTWNSGVVTTPATCTSEGVKTFTCTVCGATRYEYTGEGTYGDWTATEPSVSGSTVIETKTQYKSREKSYKSSTSSSLSGYTRRTDKEPTVSYGAYGNWSAWTPGSMSGSDTREVENNVIYRYYAFVCPNCGQRDPYKGGCSKCGYNLTSAHSAIIWSSIAYKNSNSYEYLVSAKRATKAIDGAVWIFNTEDLNKTNPGMYSSEASAVLIDNGYRYRDRTKTTTYYYEKWSDWSDWSDTEVKASDTVEVQTRTLYRTFTPAVGGSHTWNSGVVTTPATCTSEGVKTFTCTVCTATKTETIAKLNHNYTNKADAKYLKSAATETSAAVYYMSCSVCGVKGTETFTSGDPLPPAVETDTVLGVSSAKTTAGKEIILTLSLEKNPGMAGLSVSLNYDTAALTLKSANNGTLFTSFTSGQNFIFDNASNVTSDGTVATFTFTVNDNAAAGDYTVTPVVRSCVNDEGEDVPVKVEKGTVTVTDFIYGDANDDEMIDMKDVVLLRRYLAEFDYETNSSPVEIGLGADANGDDEIDMKDVVLLRRYLAEYDYETDTSSVVLGPQ